MSLSIRNCNTTSTCPLEICDIKKNGTVTSVSNPSTSSFNGWCWKDITKMQCILSNVTVSECFTFYCIIWLLLSKACIYPAPLQIWINLSVQAGRREPHQTLSLKSLKVSRRWLTWLLCGKRRVTVKFFPSNVTSGMERVIFRLLPVSSTKAPPLARGFINWKEEAGDGVHNYHKMTK